MIEKKMNPKIDRILNCAMTILKKSGDQGLSMRKVAETADRVISNPFWSKQQEGKKQESKPPFKGS